ncbi:MAG: hypothetical protein L3J08_06095 [Flavobacteriaceae bacterium]|nr:hypothetical protein [Flavobacteriaceae bacterium]
MITDLKKLAHEILQLEENHEIGLLYKKVQEIYERIIILEYLNKNTNSLKENTNNEPSFKVDTTKIVFEEKMEKELEANSIKFQEQEIINAHERIEKKPIDFEDLFVPTFDLIKDDFSQKEEFKDTVSLDDTENLFETKKEEESQLSLNDKLLKNSIQIGLNDRIAFVNKLFDYSQSEFNKVLSILNGFETEAEAKNYIEKTLKPKLNWIGKEEIEERFIYLVERKFL